MCRLVEKLARVLLTAFILFNASASSKAYAQTTPKSLLGASVHTQGTKQADHSILPIGSSSNDSVKAGENQGTTDTEFTPSTIFIENLGQFDPRARFQAQGSGATIYFSDNAIWFTLLEPLTENLRENHRKDRPRGMQKEHQEPRKGVNLKVNLIGSNPHPKLEAFNEIATKFSYFTGGDQTSWYSEVPVWGGIRYVDIYPGMDLKLTGEQDRVVWELIVTDSSRFYDKNNQVAQEGIRIKITGQQELHVQNNSLDITTDVGALSLPLIGFNGAELIPRIDQNGEILVSLPSQSSRLVCGAKLAIEGKKPV